MRITKPAYYDAFRCIASRCPDSCCKEWDVQIDEEAAAFYRSLPSKLGDDLRSVLREEDGQTVMTIVEGRCPMWRADGLCRIQAELGEEALCHVCREFPRLRHDYGDFVELGLELSCPEAARLILSAPAAPRLEMQIAEDGEGEYDAQAMESLLASREEALRILDGSLPPKQALTALLLYGYQAQSELDGEEAVPADPEMLAAEGAALGKPCDVGAFVRFFSELEILTDAWRERLSAPHAPRLSDRLEAMARYLVERYWLQAIADYDLIARVKLIVVSCLLVSCLDGDLAEAAQMFSKEIENDADNVDAILDGAYSEPAFTDDKLLGMLNISMKNGGSTG